MIQNAVFLMAIAIFLQTTPHIYPHYSLSLSARCNRHDLYTVKKTGPCKGLLLMELFQDLF